MSTAVPSQFQIEVNRLFGIAGKTAVVTGAASGIGQAIAIGLAQCGANVIAADINAVPLGAFVQSSGEPRIYGVPGDVSQERDVDGIFAEAVSRFGSLDVLVNCAGIAIVADAVDQAASEWERTLSVNLTGTFLCSRAAARHMLRHGGGSIINISSQLASVALPRRSAYIASKGGVHALTKSLALEFAPHAIRVNEIAPGPIEVERTRAHLHGPETHQTFMSRMLLGRFGSPDDLVGPTIFLASPASRFMTGATVLVDGGYLVT
jgi:NAD(P)-dependent dehydrogenase (short-subunit alcohol dehydrogenase family)